MTAAIVGAGLAGCEAAWQLAQRGVSVTLYEMKPVKRSPAHHSGDFAELVCSNSLRADQPTVAVGLLKDELRKLNSLILQAADATRVPAGGALAVDREGFSGYITERIRRHPHITVVEREITEPPAERPLIIATGPLTAEPLAQSLVPFLGGTAPLSFFDAAAPLIAADSIDPALSYPAARYGKGGADYINCPMEREEYLAFWDELCRAEEAKLHGFEDELTFNGCLPIEVMARRGADTLRYGPLKPVGLRDPVTGRGAYAVAQLRRDNAAGSVLNLVGFQTHLLFGEQKRVFSMIPALHSAEFLRYGVMHRNSYIDSPRLLTAGYRLRSDPAVHFAGQLTGVEGYVESCASGLTAALSLFSRQCGREWTPFPADTAIGSLERYVSNPAVTEFQPMNANFGLFPAIGGISKKSRKEAYATRGAASFDAHIKTLTL